MRAKYIFGKNVFEKDLKVGGYYVNDKQWSPTIKGASRIALLQIKESRVYYEYIVNRDKCNYEYYNEIHRCSSFEDFKKLINNMRNIFNLKCFI